MIFLINLVSSISVPHLPHIQCNMFTSLQCYYCSCLRKYSLSSPLNRTRAGSKLCIVSEDPFLQGSSFCGAFVCGGWVGFLLGGEGCIDLFSSCFVWVFAHMYLCREREITPTSKNEDLKVYFTLTVLTSCPSR